MKSAYKVAIALLAGVALGFVMRGGSVDRAANGQAAARAPAAPAANTIPRFQMATWASAAEPGGARAGCYILDTITGELWHSSFGTAPVKIANENVEAPK